MLFPQAMTFHAGPWILPTCSAEGSRVSAEMVVILTTRDRKAHGVGIIQLRNTRSGDRGGVKVTR